MRLEGRRGIAIIAGVCITLTTALIFVAVAIARPVIESDLSNTAQSALAVAGISGAHVVFRGRDATVSGIVDPGREEQTSDLIRGLAGVRVVTASFDPSPVASSTPVTTPSATSTSASDYTPSTTTSTAISTADFGLESDGDGIRLTGVVPTVEAAATILSSAIETFGNERVRNEIVIDPQAGGAAWLDGIPSAIVGLAMASEPGLLVAPPIVTVSGAVANEASRSALIAVVQTTGLDVRDRLTVAPSLTSDQAAHLEASLNSILAKGTVLFQSGSAEITPTGAEALDAVAETLRAVAGADVEIRGHTDSTGDPDQNLALSQARADAVVAHLVTSGVDPAGLSPIGYGDTLPIATNLTETGRTANRRTEFTVEGSPS